MASKQSRKKTLLKIALAVVIGLALLVAACPLWFPWVLKPLLGRYQVQVESYDRQGYARLALRNSVFDRNGTRVTAREIVLLQPIAWLWAHYVTGSSAERVQATDWTLNFSRREKPPGLPSRPAPSTTEILDVIDSVLPVVREWVPAARLTQGTITFAAETIQLPEITWKEGRLRAQAGWRGQAGEVDAHLQPPYRIAARLDPLDVRVETELRKSGPDWSARTDLFWLTNQAQLAVRFVPGGYLPHDATLTGSAMTVPAELLGLPGYEDPNATLSAVWTNGLLEVGLEASAIPGETNGLPPLRLATTAMATTNSVRIESFTLRTPAISARLDSPINVVSGGELPSEGAALELGLMLDQLPLPNLAGYLGGELLLVPGTQTRIPQATLHLKGTNLTVIGEEVARFELKGNLNWPTAVLSQLDVVLADQSTASVSGTVDLQTREIQTARWQVEGTVPGLPAGAEGTGLKAQGTIEGSWTNPSHQGIIEVAQWTIPGFHPLETRLEWAGQLLTFSNLTLVTRAGDSAIALDASATLEWGAGPALALTLNQARWDREGQPVYELEEKAELSVRLGNRVPSLDLMIRSLHLQGSNGGIEAGADLHWPDSGTVQIGVTQFDPSILEDFSPRAAGASALRLDELRLDLHWTNGPVEGALLVEGTMKGRNGETFSGRTRIELGKEGIVIEPSTLSAASGPVLTFEGGFPVRIDLRSATNLYHVQADAPLSLKFSTRPNSAFWDQLSETAGAQLVAPQVDIQLSGTPARPEGIVRAEADLIELHALTNLSRLPELKGLRIHAVLDREQLELKTLELEVGGELVRLEGRQPLNDRFWPDLFRNPRLPDWGQATGRLQITNAAVASIAGYLPKALATSGNISADLRLEPGRRLLGTLDLTNAATRAIPALGTLRDIQARIHLDGVSAKIESWSGSLGGQPVTLSGSIHANGLEMPTFDLQLKGERIPLVRKAGLLIRSDIDLRARTQPGNETNHGPAVVISGNLVPRDSLFLQDLKSLIPGGPTRAQRRPPYFRIEEQPFADWTLDVRIKAERFLRVRTPLFRGELSINMNLEGPLKEPVALGDVQIDGRIIFPFANLEIDQGSISLTTENPYDPQLLINASARAFGYSVRLEVAGTATNPLLTFNSTPPLTSEEVLLMLTAGELPRREAAFSGSQKASRLATLLGKDLLTRISGREDRADRLIIRSGENISERGTLTYHIEYRLTEDWSLIGESDRFNALNAGVKWRLYSR